MTTIFTLINGDTMYKVYDVTRTKRHGVSLLLQTKAGNWIAANGANITTPREDVHESRVGYGDWNHGHYFMGDKMQAIIYFSTIKEEACMEVAK